MFRTRFASSPFIGPVGYYVPDIFLRDSPLVRKLSQNVTEYLKDVERKFPPEKGLNVVRMIKTLLHTFTRQSVNGLLLQIQYAHGNRNTFSSLARSHALSTIELFDPERPVSAIRIVAHLCSVLKSPADMVVYRGLENGRLAYLKRTTPSDLRKLANDVSSLEKMLGSELRAKDAIDVAIKMKYEIPLKDQTSEPERVRDAELVAKLYDLYKDHEVPKLILQILEGENSRFASTRDIERLKSDIGASLKIDGFLSTSLNPHISHNFMDSKSGCCLMKILVPAGSPCFFASALSMRGFHELEVVLPPCSTFINTGVKDGVITLKYLGTNERSSSKMTLTTQELGDLETSFRAKDPEDIAKVNFC